MRVKTIHLKNFRRFTDLRIEGIPETAKLVVVVGPNGCGKSSLFDAFLHWYRNNAGFGINADEAYFRKAQETLFDWNNNIRIGTYEGGRPSKGSLYIRSAYRNDPDFSVSNISRAKSPSEQIQLQSLIQNDQTVSANYQRLIYDTTAALYDDANNKKTVEALRQELIGQIQDSMKRVFGDLILKNISDPLGAGAFYFEKGSASSYHYKNLSGGEKAAFDLLLDLHVKKKYFPSAIYCIDEAETHLHTKVQGSLTKELVSVVPDNSQLWLTTHSLGVLRACQELEANSPGSVCVIDFDGVDPDQPSTLVPVSLGRVAWEKMLSIALDDFSARIAPETIVVCEGSSIGKKRKNYDAEIYNRIFSAHVAGTLFVSGGSSQQVAGVGVSVGAMLMQIVPNAKVVALADRDDKSAQEVDEFERDGNIVLPARNLESFLLSDEILVKLANSIGKSELADSVLQLKAEKVAASILRGNPNDDLKSAAGEIYVGLKTTLALQQVGNTADAFMRDTLAPLITPDTETYKKLYQAVIGRLVSV
ncbi:AAA family ATPase [Hyphomonas jannaschiana]|uniref:AAA family ATPase n=1 Tax=Hyphomonas jannaschiana TaxID=86 RepID=UPI0035C713BD